MENEDHAFISQNGTIILVSRLETNNLYKKSIHTHRQKKIPSCSSLKWKPSQSYYKTRLKEKNIMSLLSYPSLSSNAHTLPSPSTDGWEKHQSFSFTSWTSFFLNHQILLFLIIFNQTRISRTGYFQNSPIFFPSHSHKLDHHGFHVPGKERWNRNFFWLVKNLVSRKQVLLAILKVNQDPHVMNRLQVKGAGTWQREPTKWHSTNRADEVADDKESLSGGTWLSRPHLWHLAQWACWQRWPPTLRAYMVALDQQS